MKADVKTILFLVLFLVVGLALFPAVVSVVNNVTTPTITKTVVSGNTTTTTTVPNPSYVGSNDATIVSLIPIFYVLALILVPAFIVYKIYKGED
jgi:hypothetical protein